jgi:phosphoribosylglycinamide formyltransferase-1
MPKLELGVLVSGSGTNLGAILEAVASGRLDARVRLVISNKPGVKALERAEAAGVRTLVVSHKAFATRSEFDAALAAALRDAGVEWVVLAGFMRVLGPGFLDAFPMRVVNIHPALLPSFPGVDAQSQALAYGVRVTGCTVHLVDAGTDTGPIIAQAAVPVAPGDDRDALAARILVREHELLVTVLCWIAEGRVSVEPGGPGARPSVRVRDREPWLGLAGGA